MRAAAADTAASASASAYASTDADADADTDADSGTSSKLSVIAEEDRVIGVVTLRTYLQWFRAGGGLGLWLLLAAVAGQGRESRRKHVQELRAAHGPDPGWKRLALYPADRGSGHRSGTGATLRTTRVDPDTKRTRHHGRDRRTGAGWVWAGRRDRGR